MFKATFTKIKRACVIALVPRIVRGDGRYTTRKFGKSSINVLRKAGKSTDSGSKDGDNDCDKCKRFIEFVFGPSKPKADAHIIKEKKTGITNIQENNNDNDIHGDAKTDSKNEKRNRLLRDFFGADEDVLRHDNFNKDARIQATAIDKQKYPQNKHNLNDDLGTGENIVTPQSNGSYADSESELSSGTKRGNFEKDSHAQGYRRKGTNPRNSEIPDHIPVTDYKLQATTAKQNEEKLTQKIEDIDETPHVEASATKVEGFNIAPKMLGDRFVNISDSTNSKPKSDFQKSLDTIAKKCMDVPTNQIDNKLIQEMEKVGYPNAQKSVMDEDFVQMDALKKQDKPLHEVEIELDNREHKREPVQCAENEKIGPSFEMPPHLDRSDANSDDQTELGSYNKIEKNEESNTFRKEKKETASTITVQAFIPNNADFYDSKPSFDVNKPIIDPYGKNSLAFDSDELEEALMYAKFLDDQRIGKPSENQESRDQTIAESYVTSSGAIPVSDLECNQPVKAKDTVHLDHVQSVYDCAPRELNWRPYPSFEAREEVMDFYTQHDEKLDSLKFGHTEPTVHMPSTLELAPEQSYEPQSNYIYSSTTNSSESREQISHSFVQPEEMINPLMDKHVDEPKASEEQKVEETTDTNSSETFESLPSLNPDGNVSLSELLRRVRMRNRLEYCREFALHTLNVHAPETLPAEGKCGKKTPPCPPPPPKCPPPSPCPPRPPACPPAPPPCPRPCKPACPQPCPPPKKNPCNKFKKKCGTTSIREILTLLAQNNPQVKIPQKYLVPVLAYKTIDAPEPAKDEENLLTENLVFRLSVLGKILLFHCTEAVDSQLPRNRSELSFARDFEPWTPIPSWPIPKKEEKKRFVCPKEGCKVVPPPKLNAPCQENPCLNFPKRSNFSVTNLFSFSLVESLVHHTA